ncbi:MAG: Ornithine carbamoyltransferase [Syntrophus sp. PtaU1.Bin005]|jgi:ornithine carbamoyltransferase|uniref:ornithine carbamoyltransferase n=1 Tax=Syntrophus TaxID=43773 RepID=UPI0009CD2266|nr:MAG: Ornithine carbamoyltransferase [Syntrophus sp. PtaB.Bin138]OPY82898.1 MAG: Ornithine carbamoyltransferase [Syntrophus sp. PtaU1.Bin005]
MKKDLLSVYDLGLEDFKEIFEKARHLKSLYKEKVAYAPLKGKTLGMIFDKSSTRTRVSFEVGIYQLGGLALFLSSRDTQLGRGEPVSDTAQVMSRYLDGIMIRTYSQQMVEDFAAFADIPVINGLTDLLHPCQILSDLFTLMEKQGTFQGKKIAYIGDGNNIANSWINAAARLPFHLALACPEGYDPDESILARGIREAQEGIVLHRDPAEAARNADVLYTDVWASMGQEEEQEERVKAFQSYQISSDLLSLAGKDAVVMHCLPAHRGEEIAEEVIDGPQSIVIDQAENRLHVQKAIMELLM